MDTPHDLFRQVLKATGDPIAAIRAVRGRFGLSLQDAKEVWLQTTGRASSLDEHQKNIARAIDAMKDEEP